MKTIDADKLVRDCIHQVAPEADLNALPPDADLRDSLQLDSLDFLQIVELLSERGGVRIDEEDYPRLATLTSTIEYLATRT